jgi:hypothetical protein
MLTPAVDLVATCGLRVSHAGAATQLWFRGGYAPC